MDNKSTYIMALALAKEISASCDTPEQERQLLELVGKVLNAKTTVVL